MKIHERYPASRALYTGGRLSFLGYPLRFLLSRLYGFHSSRIGPAEKPAGTTQEKPLVVSIGNIEWGGGGKTPCTIALCEALIDRGERPVVVTRGYRSDAERSGPFIVTSRRIDVGSAGLRFLEEEGLGDKMIGFGGGITSEAVVQLIGDEPSIYRARGIPVVIDRRRDRGVRIASRVFDPTHVMLDDAFQNRSTARDVDIVLLDHENPFGSGELMPLGSLRERPKAVKRADIIIFTRASGHTVPPEAEKVTSGKPIFFSRHRPTRLVGRAGEEISYELLRTRKIALLSGIARSEAFEKMIRSMGCEPVASFRFADHHRYDTGDIRWMLERLEGDCFVVTTEKDMVKVKRLFPKGKGLAALLVRMDIDELDRLLERLPSVKPLRADRSPREDATST
mgnify:CR=1 FL=1